MDFNDYHKRDGYDLQYNRSSAPRLPSPGEYVEPRLDDRLLRYSKLEKQLEEFINDSNLFLNEESKELGSILDEAHFLFRRLMELDPGSILNTSPPMFLPLGFEPRRDAPNELTVLYKRKKAAECHRDELSQKLESLLIAKSQTFQGVKGDQGDTLLYRVQVHPYSCSWSSQPHRNAHNPSGTKWYPLGYRCSGWNSFSPITNKDIINHMNKVIVGTPLISVSESPDRLIKILDQISRGDEHATVIEVFSLRMLQHIGVLQARSTDICDKRGIPRVNGEDVPEAARWTTYTHWVVLHWIPIEALVATMTPQEFRAVARNQYVTKADFPRASLVVVQTPIQTQNHISQPNEQFRSLGLSSGNTPQEAIDLTIASETRVQPAEQATAPTASSNPVHTRRKSTSKLSSHSEQSVGISSSSVPPPQPIPTPVTEPGLRPTTLPQSKSTKVSAKSILTVTSNSLQSDNPSQTTQPGNTTKPSPKSPLKTPPGEPPSRATQSTKPMPIQSFFNTRYPIPDKAPVSPPSVHSTQSQATTGAKAPTAGSGGLFSGFQPTPRPSLFSTETTTATGGGGLFGRATMGTNTPAASTGGIFGQAPTASASGGLFSGFQPTPRPSLFSTETTTATGGGGLFGRATMGTNTPATSTGGIFGQAPTASASGGLFGQARTETGVPTAAGGRLFGQATVGTNPTTGDGERLFGQTPTGVNAPTDNSRGLYDNFTTGTDFSNLPGGLFSNLDRETEGKKPELACKQQ